jgi:ComF family protein
MIQTVYDSLLTLAYPQNCHICENSVEQYCYGVVCQRCWNETRTFSGDETICHKCGRFLSDKPNNHKTFCHQCDEHFYDLARAVGKYDKGLSASVLNLKRQPTIPRHLRNLLIQSFYQNPFRDITRIIPVPLSKRRFYERGFNQATVLAEILAKESGVVLDKESLVRTKHTPVHRAGMDQKGREMSVTKAFALKREKLFREEIILLVDDVFTSGATSSKCAQILKKKGADKVCVLTLARTA